MKTFLGCIPCFMDQALRAGKIAADKEQEIKRILDEVGMMIREIPMENSPPVTGRLIYRKVREITGNHDPYREIKRDSTRKALAMYPDMKERLNRSEDRLMTAIRIAIAGNVIDFGPNQGFDLERDVEDVLAREFAVCDYEKFREGLGRSDKVLYIADNAGETVFDRILIEEMGKDVVYAVKEEPVINDATFDDAVQAGIDKVAEIMSSGTDAPGTILNTCSDEFLKVYNSSRFIISKGQGNYEALSGEQKPIFFMLKAKCRVIADDIGVGKGDIILKSASEQAF